MQLDPDQPLKKFPQFTDYLKPNLFIQPWLLPYLPEDITSQDVLFIGSGCFLSVGVGILFHWLGANDYVAAGIALTVVALLTGESEVRYMIAGARFGRAKREYRMINSKTNKQEQSSHS